MNGQFLNYGVTVCAWESSDSGGGVSGGLYLSHNISVTGQGDDSLLHHRFLMDSVDRTASNVN